MAHITTHLSVLLRSTNAILVSFPHAARLTGSTNVSRLVKKFLQSKIGGDTPITTGGITRR